MRAVAGIPRALAGIPRALADTLLWDPVPLGARLRLRLEQLLTLLAMVLAIGLSLGFQVLGQLPASWRARLLGDDGPVE